MEFADFLINIEQILDRHHLLHNIVHRLERIERKLDIMATNQEQFDKLFNPFLVALTDQLNSEADYQKAVGAYVTSATAAIATGYPVDLTEEANAVSKASSQLSASADSLATAAASLASAQSDLPPAAS